MGWINVRIFSHPLFTPLLYLFTPFYGNQSSPKVLREQRINQWIDGRVAVSQPEQHWEDDGADTVPAEGPHDVHAEEGKPAEDEPSHYDAEGLGCFGLHAEAFYLET